MPSKIPLKQVKVGLKPEHFEKLKALAEAKGITKADWIRRKLKLEYADARQPTVTTVSKTADPKVLYELQKIGNNLNQIALHANVNKALDRTILTHFVSIEDRLKALL